MKLDQESAAKFLIVAWVKDWKLRTYLDVLGNGEKIRFEDAHKFYPWLPDNVYILAKGYTRRFVAETMRPISEALWNADTNEKRLLISKKVQSWVCDSSKYSHNEARYEDRKQIKRYVASQMAYGAFQEHSQSLNTKPWAK